MKYHIKPLGMTKTQGFCQYFYGYDLFVIPVEITWTFQWHHMESKDIFKKLNRLLLKT